MLETNTGEILNKVTNQSTHHQYTTCTLCFVKKTYPRWIGTNCSKVAR